MNNSSLQSRSHNNDLIERAFINKILESNAKKLRTAQDRALKSAPDDKRIEMVRYSRSFNVSNETLTHQHNIQQRFIDMRRTRYGTQKPVKVHNTNLYRHFNYIIFEVKNTLTDALRAQISKELKMELYG